MKKTKKEPEIMIADIHSHILPGVDDGAKDYAEALELVRMARLDGTQLLFLGDQEVISQAFGVTPKDNMVFLPRVMSRKKQVVPSLSALWG